MKFQVKCTQGIGVFNLGSGETTMSFEKGKCYEVEDGYIRDDLGRYHYVGSQAKCAKDVVFGFHEHHRIYTIDFEDECLLKWMWRLLNI